jgi:uncharacterized RmlC-like cupin family protein
VKPAPSNCKIIQAVSRFHGKQGFQNYGSGISAESAGAKGLCMHLLTMSPGERAKAHLHENHETAIYVIQGEGAMWYGPNLTEHLIVKAGELLYIPAGMPHLPYNPSKTQPCVAVIARTDPNEQESVVLLPKLDSLRPHTP